MINQCADALPTNTQVTREDWYLMGYDKQLAEKDRFNEAVGRASRLGQPTTPNSNSENKNLNGEGQYEG